MKRGFIFGATDPFLSVVFLVNFFFVFYIVSRIFNNVRIFTLSEFFFIYSDECYKFFLLSCVYLVIKSFRCHLRSSTEIRAITMSESNFEPSKWILFRAMIIVIMRDQFCWGLLIFRSLCIRQNLY